MKNGCPDGLYYLGYSYEKGKDGMQQNIQTAISYYERAGAKKHAGALDRLGWLYRTGKAGHPDIQKSFKFYQMAAALGHKDALGNLAVFYSHGYVVHQDLNEAEKYLKQAVKKGNVWAEGELGAMYVRGGPGFPAQPEEGVKLLQRVSATKSIDACDAQDQLGQLYETGDLVERDKNKALDLFQKAAANGSLTAKEHWAMLLLMGKPSKDDEKRRQNCWNNLLLEIVCLPNTIWGSCTREARVLIRIWVERNSGLSVPLMRTTLMQCASWNSWIKRSKIDQPIHQRLMTS